MEGSERVARDGRGVRDAPVVPERRHVVSGTIAGVLVVIYVITAFTSPTGWTNTSASPGFVNLSLIPRLVSDEGELWRIVTASGLHLGVLDLAASLLTVLFIGMPLEDRFGRKRYLGLLFLGTVGAGAAVMLLAEGFSRTATATGASVALIGAALVVARRLRVNLWALGGLVVADVVVLWTQADDISLFAPLGGLVTGLAVAGVLVAVPSGPRRGRIQTAGLVGVFAVLVVLIVIGMIRTG